MCHWCSCRILTPSVMYHWTDAQQHGIYLFYIIKKQTTTEKPFESFNMTGKPTCARPLWQTRKKAIWSYLFSIQMKQSHWSLSVAKESWLAQENQATVTWLERCSWWSENLQQKHNWIAKSVGENEEKIETVFVINEPCKLKSLDVVLNITGVEKIQMVSLPNTFIFIR